MFASRQNLLFLPIVEILIYKQQKEGANKMAKAIELYKECMDMDFMDYSETLEKDLLFISELLKEFSYEETKQMLLAMLF